MNAATLKRLASIAFIGSIVLAVFLHYNSIHNTIVKILTVSTLIAFWGGLLCLIWQRKAWRYTIAAIPIIGSLFFALPSRDRSVNILRDRYSRNMLDSVDARYVWGGENSTGIDCSGLPRKALRDALWQRGISLLDGEFLRQWLEQWWFDASAEALAKNYRDYTVSLPISGTIRTMNYKGIEVGDLAITDNGVHVLVYLGDDAKGTLRARWIQADPHTGKVIVTNGRVDRSAWLDLPVTIYRWKVLA